MACWNERIKQNRYANLAEWQQIPLVTIEISLSSSVARSFRHYSLAFLILFVARWLFLRLMPTTQQCFAIFTCVHSTVIAIENYPGLLCFSWRLLRAMIQLSAWMRVCSVLGSPLLVVVMKEKENNQPERNMHEYYDGRKALLIIYEYVRWTCRWKET